MSQYPEEIVFKENDHKPAKGRIKESQVEPYGNVGSSRVAIEPVPDDDEKNRPNHKNRPEGAIEVNGLSEPHFSHPEGEEVEAKYGGHGKHKACDDGVTEPGIAPIGCRFERCKDAYKENDLCEDHAEVEEKIRKPVTYFGSSTCSADNNRNKEDEDI